MGDPSNIAEPMATPKVESPVSDTARTLPHLVFENPRRNLITGASYAAASTLAQ